MWPLWPMDSHLVLLSVTPCGCSISCFIIVYKHNLLKTNYGTCNTLLVSAGILESLNISHSVTFRLLLTEKVGGICRDECVEGLRFYPNLFLTNVTWITKTILFISLLPLILFVKYLMCLYIYIYTILKKNKYNY